MVKVDAPPTQSSGVHAPDNIQVELLQAGPALPPAEPWASMPNVGVG